MQFKLWHHLTNWFISHWLKIIKILIFGYSSTYVCVKSDEVLTFSASADLYHHNFKMFESEKLKGASKNTFFKSLVLKALRILVQIHHWNFIDAQPNGTIYFGTNLNLNQDPQSRSSQRLKKRLFWLFEIFWCRKS